MCIKILKQVKLATLTLLAVSSFSFGAESCVSLKGCAQKVCQVEKQISIAKETGNKHKIDGLNEALNKINTHCSDDKIISSLEDDLSKANDELKEHQEDLKEAHAEEKSDKIEKYNAKIKEDEAEISELKEKLSKMNSDSK